MTRREFLWRTAAVLVGQRLSLQLPGRPLNQVEVLKRGCGLGVVTPRGGYEDRLWVAGLGSFQMKLEGQPVSFD